MLQLLLGCNHVGTYDKSFMSRHSGCYGGISTVAAVHAVDPLFADLKLVVDAAVGSRETLGTSTSVFPFSIVRCGLWALSFTLRDYPNCELQNVMYMCMIVLCCAIP